MIRVDRGAFSSDGSEDGLDLSDGPVRFKKSNGKTRFALSPETQPQSSPRLSLADILKGRSDVFSDGPSAVVGQSINGVRNKRPTSNGKPPATSTYKRFTTPPAATPAYPAAADRDLSETLNRLSGENYELRAEFKLVKKRNAQLEKELGYVCDRKTYYKKAAVDSHAEAQKSYEINSLQKSRLEDLEKELKEASTKTAELTAQLETANKANENLEMQLQHANVTIAALKDQIESMDEKTRVSRELEEGLKTRCNAAEKRVLDLEAQIAFMERICATSTSSPPGSNPQSAEQPSASSGTEFTPPTVYEGEPRAFDAELAEKKAAISEASETLKGLNAKVEEKLSEVELVSHLLAKLLQSASVSSPPTTEDKTPVAPPSPAPEPEKVTSKAGITEAAPAPTPMPTSVSLDSASQNLLDSLKMELTSLPSRISEVLEATRSGNEQLLTRMKDFMLDYPRMVADSRPSRPRSESPSLRRRHSPEPRRSQHYKHDVGFADERDAQNLRRARSIPRMVSTHSLQPEAFVAETQVPGLSDNSTLGTLDTVVGDNAALYNDQILAELKRQLIEQDHPHRADALRFAGSHLNRV